MCSSELFFFLSSSNQKWWGSGDFCLFPQTFFSDLAQSPFPSFPNLDSEIEIFEPFLLCPFPFFSAKRNAVYFFQTKHSRMRKVLLAHDVQSEVQSKIETFSSVCPKFSLQRRNFQTMWVCRVVYVNGDEVGKKKTFRKWFSCGWKWKFVNWEANLIHNSWIMRETLNEAWLLALWLA